MGEEISDLDYNFTKEELNDLLRKIENQTIDRIRKKYREATEIEHDLSIFEDWLFEEVD